MNARPTPAEIMQAQGVPNRRMEDWKYTDVRSTLSAQQRLSEGHASVAVAFTLPVEFLNDRQIPEWAARKIALLPPSGTMDAAARGEDLKIYRVPVGAEIVEPMRTEHLSDGYGAAVVFVEANASVALEELYNREIDGQSNTSLLLFLDEGASMTLTVAASYMPELVLVETISVLLARDARLTVRLLNGGAKLSRTELNVTLAGEGAAADLSGVSVLGDGAHADITTRITHAAPNTTSRQLFKKVAGGKSRAVYQGKVTVKEGAIGSDSRQTAKALLLSNHAEADLKPELDILADDVKCAHGAAVGDLDQESLFYLRSRGIPEDEARSLLVHAFLQEVIDGFENEEMRNSATAFVDEGLALAMQGAA